MRTQVMKNLIFGCFGMLVVFSAGSLTVHAEEASTETEVASVESTNNYGGVDVSYGASALEADAKAEYTVGWDSEEGMGIEANAEANAVVAEANQSSSFGSDNNNIGYEMDAAVGKADAKASAAAIYDDGGITIDAEVKAEAIAAEISTGVSATVGGVNAEAKVTGQVGIGASVGASYSDGKIEVEIGGALGVGAKVNASVDASKVFNNMPGSPFSKPRNSGIDFY